MQMRGGKSLNKTPQTLQNLWKIYEHEVFDSFGSRGAPWSVPEEFVWDGSVTSCSLLVGKGAPEDAFLEIQKIGNGTKTDQLPLRGHFDSLRIVFLKGSDKYTKSK